MTTEQQMLAGLVAMAEGWAQCARTSLRERGSFSPVAFTVGRRPEERALLGAAVELADWVARQPGGLEELAAAGLADPIPQSHSELQA